MTPTTFPCPFCSKKMGVGPELLGRKVRCPNCKEVLVAPAPAPPAPPVAVAPPPPPPPPVAPPPAPAADYPVFNLPNPETQDSIFGEAADESDDVFGSDPGQQPVPEMPPPVAPPPPPMAVFASPPAVVPLPPSPPLVAVVAYPPPPAVAATGNPWAGFDQAPPPVAAYPAPVAAPEPLPVDEPPRERRPRPDRSRPAPAAGGGPNTLFKVGFFVLIPYALLTTVLAVYGLFIRDTGKAPEGHPLSLIPDGRGEFPPADRKKTGKLAVPIDGPLPPELRAGLGKKVTVGDVEVEPVAVAVRKLTVVKVPVSGKTLPVPMGRAVTLTLHVRNTSTDLTFHPLDPAFNRKSFPPDLPPTTLVVAGKDTFPGGPVTWPYDKNVKRAYETSQEGDDQPLGPGESRKYVITSDARPEVVKAVQGARDTIVWRVQVRRGLVEYRGREVPVTALVGVEFQASDVTEE
ncbi:MAG TPA: hypothetical protein VD866_15745 [Urbifossiella sp.]|nr:hypothetical protein [Urbifossiella sp.]